uniref:Uncharacterized protein n=1 Tax=Lygus hesperus TaxID=30085 RepID=A0A146KTR6_LYGHE
MPSNSMNKSPRFSTNSSDPRLSSKRRKPGPKPKKKTSDKLQDFEMATPVNNFNLTEENSGNLASNSSGKSPVVGDGPVLVSVQSLNLPRTAHSSSHISPLPVHSDVDNSCDSLIDIKYEQFASDSESLDMSLYPEVVIKPPRLLPLSGCALQLSGSTSSVPSSPALSGRTRIDDVARSVAQLEKQLLHMGAVIHEHALQINQLRQDRDRGHERVKSLEKELKRSLINRNRQPPTQ